MKFADFQPGQIIEARPHLLTETTLLDFVRPVVCWRPRNTALSVVWVSAESMSACIAMRLIVQAAL
ncbi:hypothetical protein ATN89_09190 [Comamonas thiooxydans]|nr:hypothetical protein ATN89_09190 [Comamonas thiooxydans]